MRYIKLYGFIDNLRLQYKQYPTINPLRPKEASMHTSNRFTVLTLLYVTACTSALMLLLPTDPFVFSGLIMGGIANGILLVPVLFFVFHMLTMLWGLARIRINSTRASKLLYINYILALPLLAVLSLVLGYLAYSTLVGGEGLTELKQYIATVLVILAFAMCMYSIAHLRSSTNHLKQ